IPAGRYLLGWDSTPPADSTVMHRLSHPAPSGTALAQMYSQTFVVSNGTTCANVERPNFIYSRLSQGGTYPGSSGAPVVLSGGYVVGQLLGACGPAPTDGCDPRNRAVDGAFAITYDSIKQWIDSDNNLCTQNATTLCLSANRFAVTATWQTGDGKS